MQELSARSSAEARRLENLIFGIQNSIKAITGYQSGLLDTTIMARKAAFERDLRRRVDADPALRARYGSAWSGIATAERERAGIARTAAYHGFGPNPPFGSQLLGWAGDLVRLPAESALADAQRMPRYRGANLERLRASLLADRPVD